MCAVHTHDVVDGLKMRRPAAGERPRVAVSACLLGQEVRYDGGHKQSHLVKDLLATVFELLPVCPEVGIGLGTPREPIRLVKMGDDSIQVRGTRTPELDVTARLSDYADAMAERFEGLAGYILMQKSPSCGLFRVKLYDEAGQALLEKTAGRYAARIQQRFPLLPMEEAGRLNDPVLLENFVMRVFTDHEWQRLCAMGMTHARLQDFHSRHKLLLLAHDPAMTAELGKLLANAEGLPLPQLITTYRQGLVTALSRHAGRRQHGHVLQYMTRFLRTWLNPARRREWQGLIAHYRAGVVPLIVPLTLAKHYSEEHPESFLARQVYLQPHPLHLGLRNNI